MKAPRPPRDAKLAVADMTPRQAEREHARLEAEIKGHDERYYGKDAPSVSDAEYDAVRMLSLQNAFSDEDVSDFVSRIRRFLNRKEDDKLTFTAEPKIDGLSMSLRYE